MLKKFIYISSLFFILILSNAISASPPIKKISQKIKKDSPVVIVGKKASPAVVFIKSEFSPASTPFHDENAFDLFNDDLFRRFFGAPKGQRREHPPQIAEGSGFIVSKDGYILTNNHNVQNANKITVTLNNSSEELPAKLIGADPRSDIAVLKIDIKDSPYLTLGNSDELDMGEEVIAIGNPFGLKASLTTGVISATGRTDLEITKLDNLIQTDAPINPGNSGGPLLNLDGEVIGINTAIITRSGGYMGIGFAIPSNMANYVMHQIIKTGTVKRGWVGIQPQPVDKEMAEAFNLEKSGGVLVSEVVKDSPADKASLKEGDIITEINSKEVKDPFDFRNAIAHMTPGEEAHLKILRKGKAKNITVSLGEWPDQEVASKHSEQLGLEVSPLKDLPPETLHRYGYNANMQNLIITSVKSGSLALKAGLRPGMLLLQINDKELKDISDFNTAMQAMDKKKVILLKVRFQNITRFYTIRLK